MRTMTDESNGATRIKQHVASAGETKMFLRADASSPAPQAPPFLGGLPGPGEVYAPRFEITKQLRAIIEVNAYQGAFQSAIDIVSSQEIPELERITTLDQYYFFVDAIVRWMPELRVWEWQGGIYHERTDYLRITQFYYYFNQRQLQALQSPIAPVAGLELTPISRWLRDFAVAWGAFLDTPESAKYLESYKFGPEYTYQDFGDGTTDYPTFNAWFSRTFTDITRQRPVAQPDNDRIVCFPAESTFVGQWAISTPAPAPMPLESAITVKHVQWPIHELLAHSEHGKDFEGGVLVHSFLNVYDYHRQHAPVSGTILEARFIPGQVYLQVELLGADEQDTATKMGETSALANAVIPKRYLDADDATGYQFVQCRGLMVIDSPIGKVAVLPMGMAHVSSVVFMTQPENGPQKEIRLTPAEREGKSYEEQVAEVNARLKKELVGSKIVKGDMISTFLFGGSDIVVVFPREACVNITAQPGVHYPVRSQYAQANIAKLKGD